MTKIFKYTACTFLGVSLWFGVTAQNLAERLAKLPDVVSLEKMEANSFFKEAFILMIKQPLDHKHPELGSFNQRVVLSNLSESSPVVLITEGYEGEYATRTKYLNELCPLLNANQLFIEHRFFGKSVPDSIDWRYLTVENAAADHHRVIELFKTIYHQKWISTGISKGGETALYHLALYPKDVDISVPYVAPLNFSVEEKRHDYFIRHLAGKASERRKVALFQSELLKRKSSLLALFTELCKEKKYVFKTSVSEIYDYCVLEFAFSFWQWGSSVKDLPNLNGTDQEFLDFFVKICSPSYFDFESGKSTFPFFIQAEKELGYYAYNTMPFKNLMELSNTKDYVSRLFVGPEVHLSYDPAMSLKVKDFLRKDAKQVLLIYGEVDPWSASAAKAPWNPQVVKIVQKHGSHRSRIGNMPSKQKKKAMRILTKWMNS
jgi:PS-10 peptidase S37